MRGIKESKLKPTKKERDVFFFAAIIGMTTGLLGNLFAASLFKLMNDYYSSPFYYWILLAAFGLFYFVIIVFFYFEIKPFKFRR